MCIRDSNKPSAVAASKKAFIVTRFADLGFLAGILILSYYCLLYTSDAADERSSVDLGGRRIIKNKKNHVSIGTSVYQQTNNNITKSN